MLRTFLLVTALVLLLLAPANAERCIISESKTDAALGPLYVVNGDCQVDCAITVFEESNGVQGLQRQDEVRDDTCAGQIPPDRTVERQHKPFSF